MRRHGLGWCPEPSDPTNVTFNLGRGEPMPPGDPIYIDEGEFHSPGETQHHEIASGYDTFGYTPPPDSNRVKGTVEVLELEPGQRLRASISWSGCAAEPTGTAPGQVAVDYDLLLYRPDTDEYVWGSQSVYDNNEGYDYTVQPGEGGQYEIMVTWPEGASSCEGTNYEPLGVAFSVFN